ncbi:MAG: TMEM175 family protein [Microbacterium sp.]|uniref:TMEM175 family protein n=1 Tax=Microbacterium sp. TaxID=51671 RepID=UPI0039E6B4CB
MSDPTSEQAPPDRIFPAERLKAFADAVVAIAMTLLILPLMESVTEPAEGEGGAWTWIVDHDQQLQSFVLSFVIIAMFWITHHRVFSRVERVSNGLIWLIMLWLLSIVWLPVATAMSGQMDSEDKVVIAVYIGSMVLTCLVSLGIRLYLRRHPALHGIAVQSLAAGMAVDLSMVILFALSLGVSLLIPAIGYTSLFLMFLTGLLRRLLGRMPGLR